MRLLNGGPDRGGVALLRRALALQVHVRAAHQLGACMRQSKLHDWHIQSACLGPCTAVSHQLACHSPSLWHRSLAWMVHAMPHPTLTAHCIRSSQPAWLRTSNPRRVAPSRHPGCAYWHKPPALQGAPKCQPSVCARSMSSCSRSCESCTHAPHPLHTLTL